MYLREQAFSLRRPDQFVDDGHTFQHGQGLFIGSRAADHSIRLQADAETCGGGANADRKRG